MIISLQTNPNLIIRTHADRPSKSRTTTLPTQRHTGAPPSPDSSAKMRRSRGKSPSPAVMRERFVGLRHPMNIFLPSNSATPVVGGLNQLVSQLLEHRTAAALTRKLYQPTHSQGLASLRANFDRHLIVRPAYPPGLHLDHGFGVVECLMEQRHSIFPCALLNKLKGSIHNLFSSSLFAIPHETGGELRHHRIPITRIRQNPTLRYFTTTGHV